MTRDGSSAFALLAEHRVPTGDGRVLYERRFPHHNAQIPVESAAVDLGWLSAINEEQTAGIYAYHPPFARLISIGKATIRKLAIAEGFEEHIFPRHYTLENLRAFGWTEDEGLRSELLVVRPLVSASPGELAPQHILADPVQCLGFYTSLASVQQRAGGYLPGDLFADGAFRVYEDQGGWTLRNERIERLRHGWATAWEFSGAELVFAGLEEDVYRTRWSTLCSVLAVLDELELTHRVVAATSCFRSGSRSVAAEDDLPTYRVPTLDVELYIPQYEGRREPWIELGGGDVAGDHLTSAFGLKLATGERLCSGCQGFGWQRFAFGVLSQFGMLPRNWPTGLKKRFGTLLPPSRLSEVLSGLGEREDSSAK